MKSKELPFAVQYKFNIIKAFGPKNNHPCMLESDINNKKCINQKNFENSKV